MSEQQTTSQQTTSAGQAGSTPQEAVMKNKRIKKARAEFLSRFGPAPEFGTPEGGGPEGGRPGRGHRHHGGHHHGWGHHHGPGPRFAGREFGPEGDGEGEEDGRGGFRGRPFGPGGFGPGRFGGPGGFGPGGFGPGGFGPGGFGRGGPGGPGGRGGWGGRGRGGGGRGGRRPRGNVRAAVLALLVEEPRHGYAIMTELARRSGGLWRPSPGSVYPVLQQLQDEGLVSAEESEGRKVFSITAAGRELVEQNPADFAEPWSVAGPGPRQRVQSLFEGMASLGAATQQVARLGSAEQAERGRAVLDEARRALYRILAEEGAAEPDPFTGEQDDEFGEDVAGGVVED
jgi:DNA-binding PadR family transcriptional regulator